MSDIDKRLDEILENVMGDATLWYIGRISEKEYLKTHNTAKQAIKQLMANEFDKIIDFINKDTNDVCWKHSPDNTPMIHSSRVEFLKEYIEKKVKELKK